MQLKRNKEMEFETLKKNYKKEIIIGALVVCVIGGALTFNLTRAKYKVTDSINLAKGTVNYSVPDLRVVAIKTSEDGTNYTDVSDVPTSGYTLNTTNSICKIATTDTKDNNITIEYSDGKVNFLGVGNKNTRCYLYFDKYVPPITIPDIIIANNPKKTPPDFSQVATTDEGVYAVEDGMYGGTSYYWRGATTTNYLKFAGFCWRIVRINGDGSIRLIYDGTTCHENGAITTDSLAIISGKEYYASYNKSEYVGYTFTQGAQRGNTTQSNLKIQNEIWYNNNLSIKDSFIVNGKYCNDRSIKNGQIWNSNASSFQYASYERMVDKKSPTLNCISDDIYSLKIGTITADEIAFAGGVNNLNNPNYYLTNGHHYWSMTPREYNNYAYMFYVGNEGQLWYSTVNNTSWGIRPVINLKSDTQFQIGGDGTLNNPYIVQ